MNIVFMGTPDFAVPTLEKLLESGHKVGAVFTQPDKPKGRGMKLTPPPVKELAEKENIPVYQPQSLKKEAERYSEIIEALHPDCIVVVAYGKLLPPEILKIPRFGCINVHGSLLPKYRGAAPIQWTVLNGDKTGGVTTMLMAEGMDTGDMLLKKEVGVDENETSAEYYDRLSYVGAELLAETLEHITEIVPKPQNEAEASAAPMLSKDMSPTDFGLSAKKVYSHINGLSDWPCATAILNGKRLKLYRAAVWREDGILGKPGEIINEKELIIACGEGAVKILEIQAEGSKRMKTEDFLRGRRVNRSDVMEAG